MKHEKSDYEITKKLIYLINEMELSENEQYQIKACQIILIDIFIPKEEKYEIMKVVNMGSAFLEEYERNLFEEGIKEGKIEGKKEGKIEGKIEGKKEFAKKLKEDKVPLEKIIQYTELDSNTISKL